MEKIGEGWDYTVYEIPGQRVKKIKSTKSQLLRLLIRTLNIVPALRLLAGGDLSNAIHSSTTFVKTLTVQNPATAWFFGNPAFFEDDGYEQDKVAVMRERLKSISFEEKKDLLKKYAIAFQYMWSHGFSDTSFKFSKNYGIDSDGNVILIDFSNLSTSLGEVERLVDSGFPFKTWAYRKMTDRKLKRYYRELVRTELTVKKLHEFWK